MSLEHQCLTKALFGQARKGMIPRDYTCSCGKRWYVAVNYIGQIEAITVRRVYDEQRR